MAARMPEPAEAVPSAGWPPITVADLPDVLAVEQCAYAHPWTRGNFVDALAAGYWSVLWRDETGAVVGYALAMRAADESHLLNLTVAPTQQGSRRAEALLDAVEAHARAEGLDSIWLEVRPSNARALRLYQRRGFSVVGRRRNYYPAGGGQREDALLMNRPLGTAAANPVVAPTPSSHAVD